ncbi:hypothetical protein [Nocardioides caldifontis]|uniref:hypothetical protein n=1 Tax=Nocardioides caldifontis TaxID=2588938 RepID=UPI00139680C1|nr:hypothetical protein [Nocardioides caldifontis]
MSRKIVGGLFGKAAGAAKNPVGTAGQALGLAKTAVSTGVTVAEGVAHVAADKLRARQGKGAAPVEVTPDTTGTAQEPVPQERAGGEEATPAKKAPAAKKAAKKAPAAKKAGSGPTKKGAPAKKAAKKAAPPEPQVVLAEPAPPEEPPVDIVEQVLAAEGDEAPVGGHATEPKAASRDESHGDAAMQRAEFDEIAEEQAEALPGGDLDVETPVGTTGADVGQNPDTAEADLQQPATEPLVDPSTTKAVKAESDTGTKAARTRKR